MYESFVYTRLNQFLDYRFSFYTRFWYFGVHPRSSSRLVVAGLSTHRPLRSCSNHILKYKSFVKCRSENIRRDEVCSVTVTILKFIRDYETPKGDWVHLWVE